MLRDVKITDPVLKYKSIEALKDMADGQATKIYMPAELSHLVAGLGVAGEALADAKPQVPSDTAASADAPSKA